MYIVKLLEGCTFLQFFFFFCENLTRSSQGKLEKILWKCGNFLTRKDSWMRGERNCCQNSAQTHLFCPLYGTKRLICRDNGNKKLYPWGTGVSLLPLGEENGGKNIFLREKVRNRFWLSTRSGGGARTRAKAHRKQADNVWLTLKQWGHQGTMTSSPPPP